MIIGLTGYGNAGKDLFARRLVGEHGYTRVAFADKVRELALEANPTIVLNPGSPLFLQTTLRAVITDVGWDYYKRHMGGRAFLEGIGQGVRNVIGEGAWITALFTHLEDGKDYVITDVRQVNEAQILGDFTDSMLVRITRPGEGPKGPMDRLLDHQDCLTISNEGSIADLWAKADTLVRSIKELAPCPTSSPSTRPSSTSPTTAGTPSRRQTSSPSSKPSTLSRPKRGR